MKNEKNEEVFPRIRDKVKAIFWPAAYLPGMKTKQFFLWRSMVDHTEGIPEIKGPVVRYNPPLSKPLRCYLLVQLPLLIACFLRFDQIRSSLCWPEFLFRYAFLVAFLQMFGYYLDQRLSLLSDLRRITVDAIDIARTDSGRLLDDHL
ncbi:hypothetical protein COOONC_23836 [Cooperia oncophora]